MAEADSGLGISLEDFAAETSARFGAPAPAKVEAEQPKDVEAAGEGAVEASTPETETPEVPKLDLSWLPDDVRTDLEGVPADVLSKVEKLKGHVLRQADYTRKTQELAAQRKALEASAEKGVLWDTLLKDEAKARQVMAIMEGKPAESPAKPFHWSEATDDEIEAEMARRVDARVAAKAEEFVQERFTQPASRAQAINAEVGTFLKSVDGLNDEQRIAAFRATIDRYGEQELLALDPSVVVKLVEPEARALLAESRLAALSQSKPTARKAAGATSMPGTGGVAPVAKPRTVYISDATEAEKVEEVARRMSAQFGRHITAQDIRASMGE